MHAIIHARDKMHLGIPAVVGLLAVAAAAADNNVSTSSETDTPPDWATNNALQMNLSAPNGQVDPIQYTVIPVIPNAGPNHSNNPSQVYSFLSCKAYGMTPKR